MNVALSATPSSDLIPKASTNVPSVSANDHWLSFFKSLCSLLQANLQCSLSVLPPNTTQSLSKNS